VALVLFLDVEGAFLNAVTARLLHNLRKQGMPEVYIVYVKNLLTNRKTRLKFNYHTSGWFKIDHSVRQGDPLSMILYLYYNTDLLDIAKDHWELLLGYMDDIALVAVSKTFEETHARLKDMMEWPQGGYAWAAEHNSKFEVMKSVLMDFTQSKVAVHPPLALQGVIVKPQQDP